MDERAEGVIADTGEAIQRHVNHVDDAASQVTGFIRQHPIVAVLMAAIAGYAIGKVT